MDYAVSFGFAHSRVQLDSFTDLPLSANHLQAAAHWPEDLARQVIHLIATIAEP